MNYKYSNLIKMTVKKFLDTKPNGNGIYLYNRYNKMGDKVSSKVLLKADHDSWDIIGFNEYTQDDQVSRIYFLSLTHDASELRYFDEHYNQDF